MNAFTRTTARTRVAMVALLLVVLALVAVLATGALSSDGESPLTSGDQTEEPAADDAGDPASGTCLAGSTDCADDPSLGVDTGGPADDGTMGMCAPGVTDCVDVAVDPASSD